MIETPRIFGSDVFFKFIEVPFANIEQAGSLVHQIKSKEIAGFIMKSVFKPDQISQIKDFLGKLSESEFMPTPSGKIFPAPFAIITDTEQMLDTYYSKLSILDDYKRSNPALKTLTDTLDLFFKSVANNYQVSIPINKIKNTEVAPGTFRLFYPNRGGLHVHCGNLFQAQSMFYYSLIKNDIDMDDQLSYFVVLQQSETGGELTLYDMLWERAKRKESPENNEFIIDDSGSPIYIKDMKSFAVKPVPGDILVFSGGPIWHRVEDITGTIPRITFGGFLNFSKDNKELFYWS
ncbi:MAG: 2OG-Fe(II) oxygenase [Chitinophagales bacterium]|nr:2OG-Fe(II) oxygenase [Chitinophagales bacterium]